MRFYVEHSPDHIPNAEHTGDGVPSGTLTSFWNPFATLRQSRTNCRQSVHEYLRITRSAHCPTVKNFWIGNFAVLLLATDRRRPPGKLD